MNRLLLVLALLLASNAAQAAALKVWPIKVTLSPDHTTEAIRLTSDQDEPINLQISALAWDMDENGEFIETETGDFVFFPRLITIPPHEEKVVRVGYQGDFPPLEKPYRLIVEELPPVRTPEDPEEGKASGGVNFVLRMSLPLFVMPSEAPPHPEIAVEGLKRIKDGFRIGIKAPGTHHIGVTEVEATLIDASGEALSDGQYEPHLLRILPQRRVFANVPMDTGACGRAQSLRVLVRAEGLIDPYERSIPLTPADCRL